MEYITKIDEIITDKTKIITLSEEDVLSISHSTRILYSKELNCVVYYKNFSLEEYIGEYIAKFLDLKTVKNFIVDVNGEYFIGTKNFVDKNKKYIGYCDFKNISYSLNTNRLEKVFSLLKQYKNFEKLMEDFFKMMALDIFMRQEDRNPSNYFFELYNNFISLAPLFDYTISFDYYNIDLPYLYCNGFVVLESIDDFKDIYKAYPIFKEYLEKVRKIDLLNIIKQIFENNNFIINDKIIENYKKEEEKSQKLLQKIL